MKKNIFFALILLNVTAFSHAINFRTPLYVLSESSKMCLNLYLTFGLLSLSNNIAEEGISSIQYTQLGALFQTAGLRAAQYTVEELAAYYHEFQQWRNKETPEPAETETKSPNV